MTDVTGTYARGSEYLTSHPYLPLSFYSRQLIRSLLWTELVHFPSVHQQSSLHLGAVPPASLAHRTGVGLLPRPPPSPSRRRGSWVASNPSRSRKLVPTLNATLGISHDRNTTRAAKYTMHAATIPIYLHLAIESPGTQRHVNVRPYYPCMASHPQVHWRPARPRLIPLSMSVFPVPTPSPTP